jgi:hypothetical protein
LGFVKIAARSPARFSKPGSGLSQSSKKTLFFKDKGNKAEIELVIGIKGAVQIEGNSRELHFFILQ